MRNNRIYIAMPSMDAAQMDMLRERIERDVELFNRHGEAAAAYRTGRFGFETVVPEVSGGRVRWLWRMVGCSYVYFPRYWHSDPVARRMFEWATVFGKSVIFEEGEA